MTSPPPGTPPPPAVRPAAALAYATAGFVALLIAGLGLTSLLADAEVIAVAGLGALPGVAGASLATAGFAAAVWAGVRVRHPSYGSAVGATAAAFVGYLAGLWLGAVLTGADPARATAAAGGFATSGFALVLLAAAAVSAWCAVALVRTRARRPRWPWEDEEEDS